MPEKRYNKAEFLELIGISARTLEYYLRRGLLRPAVRSRYGYYTDAELHRFGHIKRAMNCDFTIPEILDALPICDRAVDDPRDRTDVTLKIDRLIERLEGFLRDNRDMQEEVRQVLADPTTPTRIDPYTGDPAALIDVLGLTDGQYRVYKNQRLVKSRRSRTFIYRYDEHVRLLRIKRTAQQGFSLAEVREYLKNFVADNGDQYETLFDEAFCQSILQRLGEKARDAKMLVGTLVLRHVAMKK